MEEIKTIKTEEKNLSDLDFKTIELNISDAENNDYCFLSDDLKYYLEEQLKKHKIKALEFKPYYSLGYCQGDGFIFEGSFKFKSYLVNIKHSGNYYHSNSKNIEIESYKTGKEAPDNIYNIFEDIYQNICADCEKYGYNIIEVEDEYLINQNGFNRFLEDNNILSDWVLSDCQYSNKEEKNFIKIAGSGDTSLSGLWIEDFKIKEENKLKMSITEYTEKTII